MINRDDRFGLNLIKRLHGSRRVVTYGFEGADVRALEVKPSHTGLSLRVATPAGEVALHSPLFGRFNAYNLLAVLAVLLVLGVDLKTAAARLSAGTARPPDVSSVSAGALASRWWWWITRIPRMRSKKFCRRCANIPAGKSCACSAAAATAIPASARKWERSPNVLRMSWW